MLKATKFCLPLGDDMTVYLEGRNLAQLCDVMNAELIDAWLCSNKLSLNIDKIAFTIYSNGSKVVNVDLTIRDQNITRSC